VKAWLSQAGEEEFVDDALSREANPALLFVGRVGRHHHAARHARRPHRHLGAVVEAAHHLTFRTLLKLIRWQVQTWLDEWVIEDGVLFATRHEGEARGVRKYSPGAILSIQPEQSAFLRDLVCSEGATQSREGLA
jgi:hypothetical protein